MKRRLWVCVLAWAGMCAEHGVARAEDNNCDAGGATPYGLVLSSNTVA